MQHIRFAGSSEKTGCLRVKSTQGDDAGEIYFTKGLITHTFTQNLCHKMAILDMLTWESPEISWVPEIVSNRVRCNIETKDILDEFTSLQGSFDRKEDLLSYVDQLTSKHVSLPRETMAFSIGKSRSLGLTKVYLQIENTHLEGTSFELGLGRVIIGSDAELSQLVIDHDSISKRHCSITVSKDSIKIEDIGSKNGIYYNNKLVGEIYLTPGDFVLIGCVQLQLLSTMSVPRADSKIKEAFSNVEEPMKATLPDGELGASETNPQLEDTVNIPVDFTTRLIRTMAKRHSIHGVNAFNWRLSSPEKSQRQNESE
ncbi:MAG: FHA domain-containing protein [Verrucomicrobiota bacterium]